MCFLQGRRTLKDGLSKAQEGEETEIRGKFHTSGDGTDSDSSVLSFYFLQVAIQRKLSRFWLQVLPIMFVPSKSGLLVWKTRWRLCVVR